jgi:hypothetical protein
MNDEDLRDLFAGLAMQGLLANGDYSAQEIPRMAYKMSDAMIEAKYAVPEPIPEEGITAIKPKRKPRSTT